MIWNKKGVLRIGKDLIHEGEDVPVEKLTDESRALFKKNGWLAEKIIIAKSEPTQKESDALEKAKKAKDDKKSGGSK